MGHISFPSPDFYIQELQKVPEAVRILQQNPVAGMSMDGRSQLQLTVKRGVSNAGGILKGGPSDFPGFSTPEDRDAAQRIIDETKAILGSDPEQWFMTSEVQE